MPLSEFHPVTRTNLQSKMRNFSPDQPSSMPDNDFVELLWENGHIVMQGQSSRPKKTSLSTVFPSHSAKIQEKENGDAVIPRITPFGSSAVTDSIADDFSPAALSNHVGLSAQEDEMAPWINFPVDDYYSEFLSEFSGVNANSFPGNNHNPVPMDRGAGGTSASPAGGSSHLFRDSYQTDPHLPPKPPCGVPDMGRTKPANQIPQQWQNSAQNNRPRAFDFGAGNSTTTTSGQNAGRDHLNAKTQRQGLVPPKPPSPPPPGSSGGVMNFSHFSRPAALLKANLQNADRLRSNNKASTAASSNPMESTLIDSSSGLKTNTQEQFVSTSGKADLKSSAQPPHVQASLDRSEAINWKDASRNDNINATSDTKNMKRLTDHLQVQKPSLPVPAAARRHEAEKAPEPVVASSSVCSGNGAGTSSSDPKQRAKRKITEGEDSGYHSEDAEDDSVGARKPSNARGANAKRSRAAEVHNLSERRRRDRINEKMRALQELIPNCNKVDKASMLDEAIEYLKTLQLQVQIMSMGGGLCMPPMMLPAGMQNIRAPHMAHFSPMVGMGMGMGMGMGFGMGMLDMNGSPLIPVPPMHGPQFPCSSVPGGAPGFNCIPGTAGLPMFGIPTQGVPVQMPPLPFAPPAAHSTRVNNASEANNAVETAPASSNEQRNQHLNVENGQRTDVNDSQVQASTQATRECFEHSSSVHLKNQTSTSDDAINSSSGNENSSTNTSYG